MAKKKGKKKGTKRGKRTTAGKTTRRRSRRRRNPDMGIPMAFGGGFAGRMIDGVSRYAAGYVTAKSSPMVKRGARIIAALVPAGVGYMVQDKQPALAHGFAGASGAAVGDEVIALVGGARDGKPPASWAMYLDAHDRLELASGGFIYLNEAGAAQYQAPTAAGQTTVPAPTPVKLAAPLSFRTNNGRYEALSDLASGGVLVRDPRNGGMDVLTGTNMSKLRGLVKMGGLVRVG